MVTFKSWKKGKNDFEEEFLQLEMVIVYPQKQNGEFKVVQLISYLIITADTVDYFIPDHEAEQLPATKSIY